MAVVSNPSFGIDLITVMSSEIKCPKVSLA